MPKGIDDLLLDGGAPTLLSGDAAAAFVAECHESANAASRASPTQMASVNMCGGNGQVLIAPTGRKMDASKVDPAFISRGFLNSRKTVDGESRLRMWHGEFWYWDGVKYLRMAKDTLTAQLWRYSDGICENITQSFIGNARLATSSLAMLNDGTTQPCWLSVSPPFPANEVLATKSALIHLPSLANGTETFSVAPTPTFFSSTGCNVEYSPNAEEAIEWQNFLTSIWPDDPQQIETLQEWFGYLLTADTRQQKILLMIGPKRSGKGTIARVLREVIGSDNTAGPTLAGLATNFGLWPLIGKSLAIVADARLSGRTDRAIVTERLLSISGEDALTIDRKCIQPVTCTLPTRLMLMTNEVPQLDDASGALASRFVVLRMRRSFYGREDHGLTSRLMGELPGILKWAIEGWKRLRDRGHFIQPETSAGVVADMAEITSPVSKFVDDYCIIDQQAEIRVAELFEVWCNWCEDEKKNPGNRATFGRNLFAALPELSKTQPREGGKRVWKYAGIRLRTDDDDVDEMEDEYVHGQWSGTSGTSSIGKGM